MSKCFAVFLLAAGWMVTAAAAKAEITCQSVADEVASKGPKAAVADLFNRGNGDWASFIKQVAAGHDDCIQAAAVLHPGSDAGSSEDIIYGLSQALQENPAKVLGVVGGDIDIIRVCSDRTLEGTDEQHTLFVQHATAALSHIQDPRLIERRDACVALLKR